MTRGGGPTIGSTGPEPAAGWTGCTLVRGSNFFKNSSRRIQYDRHKYNAVPRQRAGMNTRVVGDEAPSGHLFPAETLRACFPALRRAEPFIFFDNAAGAQIPQTVLDAVNRHLIDHNVQRGGRYPQSIAVDVAIASARASVGAFINARRPEEIAFGMNATSFIRLISLAIGQALAYAMRLWSLISTTKPMCRPGWCWKAWAKFLWWKMRGDKRGAKSSGGAQLLVAHLPPEEFRPHVFQHQPGRHIGFVVEIRDHNLMAYAERLWSRISTTKPMCRPGWCWKAWGRNSSGGRCATTAVCIPRIWRLSCRRGRDWLRARRQERRQILGMQTAVVAHLPPEEFRPHAFQHQPDTLLRGRDP